MKKELLESIISVVNFENKSVQDWSRLQRDFEIHFDVEMINEALDKLGCGRLKNEALDIDVMHRKLHDINDKQFSLDELCTTYNVPISDRISSAEDAFKTALLFLKLKSRLGIK